MIRVLHAARVDSDNGKTLDMEIILNLVGGIFKPEDESAGDEASLQAALSAQVRRTNYEHRGMATQERKPIKKNSDQRSPKQSGSDLSKLMQVVFDMKAEMGCMRKAMINDNKTDFLTPIRHFSHGGITYAFWRSKYAL